MADLQREVKGFRIGGRSAESIHAVSHLLQWCRFTGPVGFHADISGRLCYWGTPQFITHNRSLDGLRSLGLNIQSFCVKTLTSKVPLMVSLAQLCIAYHIRIKRESLYRYNRFNKND